MYNPILEQGKTTYLSSSERSARGISIPTGTEHFDYDTSGRLRRYRYMKNDAGETAAVGSCLMPKDADGLQKPATALLAAGMPIYVSLGSAADADYGWFQVEGPATVLVTANASATAIAANAWVCCANASFRMVVDGNSPVLRHGIATEAATTNTSITVMLPYR